MAHPSTYRPGPGEIPVDPGVYRFRDQHGRVIYVGKAKNLRSRLANYFQDLETLHPRTRQMVTTACSVEWTVVRNEVEAFALEYSWIKEYDPHFNIKYRDDKSYPYLAVSLGEKFPRIQVTRGTKKKGTRYFGPYAHAWAIRETVDLLLRVFPVRTCAPGVLRAAERSGRPCLLGYIDKCSAPCVGKVTPEEHRALASDFCDFMAGNSNRFTRKLENDMKDAAAELDFEKAARLRDDIEALTRAMEKNTVVFSDSTDADVFGLAQDELEASAQVFHVRGGRIRGQRGWIVEKVEDLCDGELVEHLLQQVYGDVGPQTADGIPTEILVPFLPAGGNRVGTWLAEIRGAKIDIRVPVRGEKKSLAETVERNAQQALQLHKLRRSTDLTSRSLALREIQEALDLDDAPLRIECYDISNLQQTHVVASMVVFEDGIAKKSDYRRFIMTGKETSGATDDTASVYEVITRRFRKYLEDHNTAPAVGEDTAKPRFAYPPNLVVVDGGAPQVAAAAQALSDLGITDVALCGLAKRLEEVWLPGDDYPVILPRTSEGLYLLQRVRDEAHRFAITFHRERRGKAMTVSALDGIPGLGPARQKALLTQFGSAKAVRKATSDEIATVPGIGPTLAEAVVKALGNSHTGESINTATGEIIDS